MKTELKKLTVCSRGHKFLKTRRRPVCPRCRPGYYGKKSKDRA